MNSTSRTDDLTITWKALNRTLFDVAALGLVLAFIGLRDAYNRIGYASSGGVTITVAIVITVVALASAFILIVVRNRMISKR